MIWIAFAGSCFLLAMIPGVSTALILRQTLRAGAALLIVMGAQSLWKARRAPAAFDPPVPYGGGQGRGGWRRSYGLGLATCGANPKAAVFAMSFLPQFVPQGADVPLALTVLAVIWVVVDVIWYVGVIWLIGRAGAVLGRPAVRRRLEQVSGTVLVAFGVRVAFTCRAWSAPPRSPVC